MRTIGSNAKNVLKENYKIHVRQWGEQNPGTSPYTIQEWCKLEAHNDPSFYTWLFGQDVSDFGSDLTDNERMLVSNFLDSL